MKIEHITHDQCHGRSHHRPSTPQNMTASSTQQRIHPQRKTLPTDERPMTLWPRIEASPPDAQSEMITYLTLEHRLKKEDRQVRTTPASRSEEARRPRRRSVGTIPKTRPKIPPPPLRRKHNFSESLKGCLGSPRSAPKEESDDRHDMTKIYTLRDAIRAGKLEKVVPQRRMSRTEERVAPPAPPKPISKPADPKDARRKKSTSASSRLGELIDLGADILEETRKDLASKFMSPFEHSNSPTFTRPARKYRHNSDSSGLSFRCIGEKETEAVKEVQTMQTRQQQDLERLSGEGTNPWTQPRLQQCMFCGKAWARGVRGLCSACETEYLKPITQRYEFKNSSSDREAEYRRPNPRRYEFKDSSSDENDIKPTPPLKDFHILSARTTQEVSAKRKSLCHSSPKQQEARQLHLKHELKMIATDSYPQVHSPASRHISQAAIVEGRDDERFRSWQTPAMREKYERTRSSHTSWSDWFETDGSEGSCRQNESSSSSSSSLACGREEVRPGTAPSRGTNFYGFYDGILKDHGVEEHSPYPRRC